MAFLEIGANSISDEYEIENSCRFNSGDSPKLQITTGSNGDRQKFTLSCWFKNSQDTGSSQTLVSFNDGTYKPKIYIHNTNQQLQFTISHDSPVDKVRTNMVVRDYSAWYHLVVAMDTTQATDTNRIKIYVNGVQQTFTTADWPAENLTTSICANTETVIGRDITDDDEPFDGYLAEVFLVDGTAYAASDFGKTNSNGVWVPIDAKPNITFGTHGAYFEFKQTGTGTNSSGIGADTSGNDNHYAVTNLAAADITTDTPTNNFANLRIAQAPANSTVVLSEGNCDFDYTQDGSDTRDGQNHCVSNIAMSSGKWYMECKVLESTNCVVGIENLNTRAYNDVVENWYGVYIDDGRKAVQDYTGQSVGYSTYGSAFSAGDIAMVALDMDNKNIYFGKDGSWGDGSGNFDESSPHTAHAITSNFLTVDGDGSNVVFTFFSLSSSASPRFQVNFGNPHFSISSGNADANGYGNFEFAVPTNYYSLCTKNLAEYG